MQRTRGVKSRYHIVIMGRPTENGRNSIGQLNLTVITGTGTWVVLFRRSIVIMVARRLFMLEKFPLYGQQPT